MTYFIYRITNKLDGKIYIGYSNDPEKRWCGHKKLGLSSNKKKQRVHLAIGKHGVENFTFDIIESDILTKADAFEREIFWIAFYKSYEDESLGYNMTPGGEGGPTFLGRKHTDEFKKRMSEIQSNRSPQWKENFKRAQQNRSEEWCQNISKGSKNRPQIGDETRLKMKEAWKKRITEGRVITPEGRERISQKLKGHIAGENVKNNVSDMRKFNLLLQDVAVFEGNLVISKRAFKRYKQRMSTKYWQTYEFKTEDRKVESQDLLKRLYCTDQGHSGP